MKDVDLLNLKFLMRTAAKARQHKAMLAAHKQNRHARRAAIAKQRKEASRQPQT